MTVLLDALPERGSAGSRAEPSWLAALRAEGRDTFRRVGWPSRRDEAWKYTKLPALETIALVPDGGAPAAQDIPAIIDPADDAAFAARLVFVDGRYRPELSVHRGNTDDLRVGSVRAMSASDAALLAPHVGRIGPIDGKSMPALNAALFEDGAAVVIAAGARCAEPIEVVWVNGGRAEPPVASFPRNLIVLGKNSRASVIERWVAVDGGVSFANSMTEIAIGAGGHLTHLRRQDDNALGIVVASLAADVAAGGRYDLFTMTIGGRLWRNDVAVRLAGDGAECGVSGAYLLRGREHCDNTTVIRHDAPRTRCREIFKGVVDDAARAVFQGSIVVERDAQHADGHQISKAILLSDDAEVDQKPELEISADDVKCSHGAAVGQLDGLALHYLRSRGLSEAAARRMMIEGFLAEAFDEIADEDVRATVHARASAWFEEQKMVQQ